MRSPSAVAGSVIALQFNRLVPLSHRRRRNLSAITSFTHLRSISSSSSSPPSDPFQQHADLYAVARPTYPVQVIEKIVLSLDTNYRRLAVDVGAGSGQLTFALAPFFDQVLAIDKSEAQLQQRNEHRKTKHSSSVTTRSSTDANTDTSFKDDEAISNVVFQQGLATDLSKIWQPAIMTTSSPSSSASSLQQISSFPLYPLPDLIACAQMYHWLLADGSASEFLGQAQSLLQHETGRLAIVGYSVPSIVDSPALQAIFEEFYYDVLKSRLPFGAPEYMWSIDRRIVDSQYATVDFPGFTVLERTTIPELKSIPLSIFIAYMKSMSAYQTLQRRLTKIPDSIDPLKDIQKRMYDIASSPDEVIQVQYPFFLILLKPSR